VAQFEHANAELWQRLQAHAHLLQDLRPIGAGCEFSLPASSALGAALQTLTQLGVPLLKFERLQASLHQIFLRNVADRAQPVRHV
jgi:hypothetical protein